MSGHGDMVSVCNFATSPTMFWKFLAVTDRYSYQLAFYSAFLVLLWIASNIWRMETLSCYKTSFSQKREKKENSSNKKMIPGQKYTPSPHSASWPPASVVFIVQRQNNLLSIWTFSASSFSLKDRQEIIFVHAHVSVKMLHMWKSPSRNGMERTLKRWRKETELFIFFAFARYKNFLFYISLTQLLLPV